MKVLCELSFEFLFFFYQIGYPFPANGCIVLHVKNSKVLRHNPNEISFYFITENVTLLGETLLHYAKFY